jgi:hypothetical protein
VIDERELADDLATAHQRDDALFAPGRRDDDFNQTLLDTIAAIAALACHKQCFSCFNGALERAGQQFRRHLRPQAGKNQVRAPYYWHGRAAIQRCVGVTHGLPNAALPRPAD